MNKLFLILLPVGVEREEVMKYLFDNKYISTWFFNMPYSFYVRSIYNSKQLQNIIIQKFTAIELIVVINITRNIDFSALVPDNHVHLYNNI